MLRFKNFIPLFLLLLFTGCSPASNKEKIIGKWEAFMKKKDQESSIKTGRSTGRKIVLAFNKDLTVNSQIVRGGEVQNSYQATYDFENDQNYLIVYREGKKDRKNTAKIIGLTGSDLALVDVSGSGDTLQLKRIK
jgi:hypothetical protein